MPFTNFFYYLRENDFHVSLEEWLVLMNALKKDLAASSLLEFYHISRAILVKREADYPKYQQLFTAFFEPVLEEGGAFSSMSEDLFAFVKEAKEMLAYDEEEVDARTNLEYEELEKLFSERLSQRQAHDGGKKWIGTAGTSTFGNSGYSKRGIRVGAAAKNKWAYRSIMTESYRDFREDTVLDVRQFETALRKLRQLSEKQGSETEFSLKKTIDATCKNAGKLRIAYQKPRKNQIRLLVLFDSGGSMAPHAALCARLFQALARANHFQKLTIYYFHNCPYNRLYETPECVFSKSVDTDQALKKIDKDTRALFVGDASMASWELRYFSGGRAGKVTDTVSGLLWLHKIIEKCERSAWLNPLPKEAWESGRGRTTIARIRSEVAMYPLTVQGLGEAVKELLS